ncbi:hypothetical protein Poli38472_006587 [Pythium oligandrum]|uniref:Uncharacterized protein n=1 Tax=Pythium oligandrum TaxID=41045 RepID=A0A8K1C5S3_PYTOL|nr:hypothetical protein Poli38472_006587 [Pythium oligandrum]|eukprot:TMW56577.1 hypothetical protein Poli38472_006587 [Pythium oligandrum]
MEQQPSPDEDDAMVRDTLLNNKQQEPEDDSFDPESFASLLQNQPLIAYNVSWDPLMKALETLASSLGRQQRAQKGNNNAMEEMKDELTALRDQVERAESDKKDMVEAVAKLQDEVGSLKENLQRSQEDQDAQRKALEDLRGQLASSSSSQPPQTGEEAPVQGKTPFVTAKDLSNVKQALTQQLKKSFSAVFGEQHIVSDDDEDRQMLSLDEGHEDAADGNNDPAATTDQTGQIDQIGQIGREPTLSDMTKVDPTSFSTSSRPSTANSVSGVLYAPLPGVPFASEAMVKAELAKLRELQAAIEAKLNAQNEQVEQLQEKLNGLDGTSVQTAGEREPSTPRDANNELVQKELDIIKAQQDKHQEQLKHHQDVIDKHSAQLKEMNATIDDVSVQQQTAVALLSPPGDRTAVGDGGPPQLDLSLVFTKIADLRRSTVASVEQLEQNLKEAAGSAQSAQSQLEALRNAVVFNERQHLRLLAAQLAMQKEVLERNQTFQDRTKPQLAEWKRAMEQTEVKLLQGLCDQEIMDEMQQLQRNYHRTMISMTPLVVSPLTVAESLQTLSEEVKELQSGIQLGVVPLAIGAGSSGGADQSKYLGKSKDEFLTKVRYLDEEVAATQQVNVVTEKRNDPLIKSLDLMREKLESMWSLWHQNSTHKKISKSGSRSSSPRVDDEGDASRSGTNDAGMRDLELRLMGAVRRVGAVEEEVERLNSASTEGRGGGQQPSAVEAMHELLKFRREMHDELARLSSTLAGLQSNTASSSSLVPTAPSGGRTLYARGPDNTTSTSDLLVSELSSQMRRRNEVDGRFHEEDSPTRSQMYDHLLKDLTKKVTQTVMQQAEKNGLRTSAMGGAGPAGVGANPNVNYRTMLENFMQKVEDRLEDSRELTAEEFAKLRKELIDMIKARIDAALRDLRNELVAAGFIVDNTGDTTAVGTKPVMCVACSRPVPVSGLIRDAGVYPPAELIAEQANALLHAELEFDRNDDDFVYRGGFKMPADRKTMTLPFLAANVRNRVALNKIERKPRRPARYNHANRVESVVREALELDRKQQRYHEDPSPPKQ